MKTFKNSTRRKSKSVEKLNEPKIDTAALEATESVLAAKGQQLKPLELTERLRLQQELEYQREQTKQVLKARVVAQREASSLAKQVDELSAIEDAKIGLQVITTLKSSGLSETVPVIMCSDWHLEERVALGTVLGRNEYSLEIYAKRLENLVRKSIALINYRKRFTKVNEIVLWLGGDFITGHIHDENKANSALPPIRATLRAQTDIKLMIERILAETGVKRLVIPCNVGNHARTTMKTWIGACSDYNHEAYMYESLKQMFVADPRVQFIIPEGQFVEYSVFDKYKIRMQHGDAIKFGGGIGGLFVPVKKRIAAWNSGCNDAYIDLMGHWHTFTPNRRFIVNGSMIGFNPYAQWCGFSYEEPIQTLFYIEKQHGLTAIEPLYLK
jgi:hypothetical protein